MKQSEAQAIYEWYKQGFYETSPRVVSINSRFVDGNAHLYEQDKEIMLESEVFSCPLKTFSVSEVKLMVSVDANIIIEVFGVEGGD